MKRIDVSDYSSPPRSGPRSLSLVVRLLGLLFIVNFSRYFLTMIRAIFFSLCLVAVLMSSLSATKITINLNRQDAVEKSTSNKNHQPAVSVTNSHTGVKITSKNHKVSTSLHSDNMQKAERIPQEKKYFKKDEVAVDHGASEAVNPQLRHQSKNFR